MAKQIPQNLANVANFGDLAVEREDDDLEAEAPHGAEEVPEDAQRPHAGHREKDLVGWDLKRDPVEVEEMKNSHAMFFLEIIA